jgi:hypothetical protein
LDGCCAKDSVAASKRAAMKAKKTASPRLWRSDKVDPLELLIDDPPHFWKYDGMSYLRDHHRFSTVVRG